MPTAPTLSPLDQRRLKLRSAKRAENVARRLHRQLNMRTRPWCIKGPILVAGQSIGIEVHFNDDNNDWSHRRVIGIYPGGHISQRHIGLVGNNGAVGEGDIHSAAACEARGHAENLTLASILRRQGDLDGTRDCLARARRIRLHLSQPAQPDQPLLLLEAAE